MPEAMTAKFPAGAVATWAGSRVRLGRTRPGSTTLIWGGVAVERWAPC